MNSRRRISTPSSGDGIVSAQTSTLIGAETGIKTIAAVHSQCLLRVKTRSYRTATWPSASPQSTDINDRDIITLGNVNALSKGKLSASSQINAPRSTAAC